MKKNIKKKLLISFTSLSFLTPLIVSAQLNEYVNNLYLTAIGLSGLLAVIMIVAGAAYLTISGASPDKQKEGKSYITAALLGLMLLLGAFVLLNTINPELVELQNPYDPNFDLPDGQQSGGAGTGVGPQALSADSTTAERRAVFCANNYEPFTQCKSRNDAISQTIGSPINIANCVATTTQRSGGILGPTSETTYNCENNIQTKEFNPNNMGQNIRWSFYFTTDEPWQGSLSNPGLQRANPSTACLVSHLDGVLISEIEDSRLLTCN